MSKTNIFNAANAKPLPTKEELMEMFDYKDGSLYWKVSRKGHNIGAKAGCLDKNGYVIVGINRSYYKLHRLIWQWHYGDLTQDKVIDHIKTKKDEPKDNRIENLKPVTHQQNVQKRLNRGKFPGVHWSLRDKKWVSQYSENGTRRHLGYYDSVYKAYNEVRNKMSKILGYDYTEPVLSPEDRNAYLDWLVENG